jgi:hypothetical protein
MALYATLAVVLAACGRVGFEESPLAVDATCGVPGAVGYWSLNAEDLVGTQVLDRSGRGAHGTLRGTPSPISVPGQHGEALDFTATDLSFVALPALSVDPNPGAATTVAMWFFHADPAVDDTLIYLPPGPGTEPPRYDLWLTTVGPAPAVTAGTPSLCINTGLGDCWGISDPGLIGRWVHVVAVFVNGATTGGTLYIDGVPATMACRFGICDQSRTVAPPFTLGGNDELYAWHGLLDDVRIFNRALTAGEAATLFACVP